MEEYQRMNSTKIIHVQQINQIKRKCKHLTIECFSGNGNNMSEYDLGDYEFSEEDFLLWYENYLNTNLPEKQIATDIFVYASPFLLLLGTLGNILSCIILKKLSKKVNCVKQEYLWVKQVLAI